jgi:radical SAM superfamily enzyme YgiQ (UPF0313 family)
MTTEKLKIGFVQARNSIDVNWFRPLVFGYLKAYLEKYLDVPFQMDFLEHPAPYEKYDIVGISSTSQDFGIAKVIAECVKQCRKETVTVLGGHHITYLPQTLPEVVDIGVIGEGEQTFLELVQFISKCFPNLDLDKMEQIKGIAFRHREQVKLTPRRDQIASLDQIPFPVRAEGESTYLFTSRGCPYKCAFCSSAVFWETTRFFSAEYVVNEVGVLLERFAALKHICICDDLFVANLPRLRTIVRLMEDRGFCGKVTFSASVRSNLVTDELCDLLKRINVIAVGIGIESGSNRILKLLNKGVSVKVAQKAIDILHKHGLDVRGSLIVGCPSERARDVRQTFKFAVKNIKSSKISPECAVNILSPMPGTQVWNEWILQNRIDVQRLDWRKLSVFASYRNSEINDFDRWLDCRRENDSFYLAESTLPQENLYRLMSRYEKAVEKIKTDRQSGKTGILKSLYGRCCALHRYARKCISNRIGR